MPALNHIEHTNEVSSAWKRKSPISRKQIVVDCLKNDKKYHEIIVLDAAENGHVILKIDSQIPANARGIFLLSLEKDLKEKIDVGLSVWLEPIGDKSKLRKLRGVEVKSKDI